MGNLKTVEEYVPELSSDIDANIDMLEQSLAELTSKNEAKV